MREREKRKKIEREQKRKRQTDAGNGMECGGGSASGGVGIWWATPGPGLRPPERPGKREVARSRGREVGGGRSECSDARDALFFWGGGLGVTALEMGGEVRGMQLEARKGLYQLWAPELFGAPEGSERMRFCVLCLCFFLFGGFPLKRQQQHLASSVFKGLVVYLGRSPSRLQKQTFAFLKNPPFSFFHSLWQKHV